MDDIRYISWNVNGIRAALNKGFMDFFEATDFDILAVQETKCQVGQVEIDTPGYFQYWNQAEKKGYSGTAVFTKTEPLNVRYGIGMPAHDNEGRVITLEFDNHYFVTCYTPNAQHELKRLDYRMSWEDAFLNYINGLNAKKPVVFCGDLNVAHQKIDLKNPSTNHKNPGFSDQEREKMTRILSEGYIDSFRHFYPDTVEAYTWWSYRMQARDRNIGWRIDYFIVSEALRDKIKDAGILDQIMGSDHCPVTLDIEL